LIESFLAQQMKKPRDGRARTIAGLSESSCIRRDPNWEELRRSRTRLSSKKIANWVRDFTSQIFALWTQLLVLI